MSRWIDADALMKRVEDSNKSAGLHLEDLRKIRRWIKTAPSIDIEPKRGEWIPVDNGHHVRCSECGRCGFASNNFCPNCGARMKGADDE